MHRGGLFGIPLFNKPKMSVEGQTAKAVFDEELNKPEYQNITDKTAYDVHVRQLGLKAARLRNLAENDPSLKQIADEATAKVAELRVKGRKLDGTRKRKHYRRKNKTQRK